MQPPKLVIFDCDGVLVESEPIFNRVLHQYLSNHGAALTFEETCELFTGKNRFAVEAHMEILGLALPQNWSDSFYTTVIDVLSKEVEPIPGIHTVLKDLQQRSVPICVGSNGLYAKMIATLTKTELLPFFEDKLYSSYDIGQSKPAPDVFLHAAAQHNTVPADCVVIEDSASGFAAAKAANMRCFAYQPHQSTAPSFFGATPFQEMADLPRLLGFV